MIILDYSGPYYSVLNYSGLYSSVLDYLGLNYSRLFRSGLSGLENRIDTYRIQDSSP